MYSSACFAIRGVLVCVLLAASGAAAQRERDGKGEYLSAGPIKARFQDGELRYLYVGDKEIIRRIYFAVRDGLRDTVVPEFTDVDVRSQQDSFSVTMYARCRSRDVDYSWRGEIVGEDQGRINFRVTGRPGRQMKSVHAGLCVLYGAESLAGQSFAAFDANDRQIFAGKFTQLLAKDIVLVRDFRKISYATADRMNVDLTLGGVGDSQAGMEDQRYFGDSSYKVFRWELAEDPNISQVCEVTLQVSGAARQPGKADVPGVRVGQVIPHASIPLVSFIDRARKSPTFLEISGNKSRVAGAGRLTMAYSPPANLADEDTLMENTTAILDQVRTVRTFAPRARVFVEPVNFESPYPRPGPDPRANSPFAVAWCARATKYMALAGVESAVFTVAEDFVEEVAKFSGSPLREATIETVGFEPIDALAVDDGGRTIVWFINRTADKQIVSFEGGEPLGLAPYEVRRIEAARAPAGPPGR